MSRAQHPCRLQERRLAHAARLGDQRLADAPLVVQAYINTAAAMDEETACPPNKPPPQQQQQTLPPAAGSHVGVGGGGGEGAEGGSGWTLISTADVSDEGESWDVVGRQPAPLHPPGCSLSYVVHQLEAPTLKEEHFLSSSADAGGVQVTAHPLA